MSDDGPRSVNNQLADEFGFEKECPTDHAHWYKDEVNDAYGKPRAVRICEDCGDMIYESDVKPQEP